MAKVILPFSVENKVDDHGVELLHDDLYEKLPPLLKKVADSNVHLLEYLHMMPISRVGLPQYHPELSRNMTDDKEPNIIYPTKRNGVFIHILFDENKDRHHYIPVEPILILNIDSLMRNVEIKLLDLGINLVRIDEYLDQEEQFLAYIDRVTTLTSQSGPGFLDKYIGGLRKNSRRFPKIKVTQRELEKVRYLFVRNKMGLGVIDPLLSDPYVEDISCSGVGNIFIEHKIFKSVQSAVTFSTFDEIDEFVLWLARRIKKPVTYKNPLCDATLPDGSRINIVFGQEVSKRGSNFTIRKFSEVPMSIFELLGYGTLNYQMLAYLSMTIGHGMNLFVSGETASGKTTLLNAFTAFIPPLAKIITIEDTPELQVPHENWLREVVQSTKVEDASGAITMFDLLKAALRQRPDEIIVGEIRGPEGAIAFQAMQTGHSVMATFHAASVEKLIQRITGAPILVPKTYIDNLNIIVLTSAVKLPSGKTGRRITSISEIVAYDSFTDSFSFTESFHWDQEKDSFEFTGYMTSYILENKIAPKLGIPSHKKQRIYAELERRTKILTKLHKEQGVTGFYEVLAVLSKAQQQGLF